MHAELLRPELGSEDKVEGPTHQPQNTMQAGLWWRGGCTATPKEGAQREVIH